uniref:Tyr recombinase domain-containing protein n=1 Tax=Trichogramma kaykai TaxID=54128 RepID=A0ABD2WDB4_9HYME
MSESTVKNYDSTLRNWWAFCKGDMPRISKPDTAEILTFLAKEYEIGKSYSTLNGIRSALALVADIEIAKDSNVKRFFKGVSKLRPAQPKYAYTWDPKVVLQYISTMGNNEDLSFKILSKKLITLLALTTGHRMQTFSLIEIRNIKISSEKIEIFVPATIKTSKTGALQPLLTLPYFHDKLICAASCLTCYLNVSRNFRKEISRLFVSTNKPTKAVGTQTLSRWVKDTLGESGVDTSVFTAHSTRHASTSKANRRGVDIEQIRKTAGWTQSSNTFARFYNRELAADNNDFALSILNNEDSELSRTYL